MVKVKVEQGWLEGEVVELCTGEGKYYSFKGIPYARPPVGELRFKAPQSPLYWEGTRDAKVHGPICPQADIFTNEFHPGNEDCLYLNIYSPELKPNNLHPVMFFIHGGGYKSGSGNDDNYGPDFFMKHNITLVTINYRLEVFGFLCLDTKDVPGNAGLKDQIAALRWVQRNISQFGGDPCNVTIFGESAGGASTGYHVLSPLSKGLFKRAILMSGCPLNDWTTSFEPRRRAFKLGKQLGCDTDDVEVLTKFLQKVPAENLVNVDPCVLASEKVTNIIIKMYHFTPVVEKDFGQEHVITKDVKELLEKNEINDVDIMLGFTSEECTVITDLIEKQYLNLYYEYPEMLVPIKILRTTPQQKKLLLSDKIHDHYFGKNPLKINVIKEFAKYLNDSSILYQVDKFNRKLPSTCKKYYYRFSCVSNRNIYSSVAAKYNIHGAAHLEDLLYLFHSKKVDLATDKNSKEYQMIDQFCTLFTNFAKFGNPTPDDWLGTHWPQNDPETDICLDIGDKLTTVRGVNADMSAFWDSIYEMAENPHV